MASHGGQDDIRHHESVRVPIVPPSPRLQPSAPLCRHRSVAAAGAAQLLQRHSA
eukprot:CAMPEP_0184528526 /NCGR_PEP_ID=MMETSP0198_2-20121128/11839_1 /TAXON_ID=1112570 /ORGANISM="Thraustochytrium sp., Strain LLF1b" /LENGTH=53 /DNA_ID=CAMNT_0026920379 /DNA_START=75 /DNA_END=232 /DNA_ORIENTATION=-